MTLRGDLLDQRLTPGSDMSCLEIAANLGVAEWGGR